MENLKEKLRLVISKIKRAPLIDEKTLNEVLKDIQRALLYADVSVDIVLRITENIKKRVKEEKLPPGFSKRELLLKIVYEELINMLGGETRYKPSIKKGQLHIVLLMGIEGSGKTTTAAKLAYFYKKRGFKVGLICADNYRPGALSQLKQLGEQIGVEVYGEENRDSIDIAIKGIEFFKKRRYDLIIIDTAGRHKDEKNLMDEMSKLVSAIKPDETILVLDATIGRQAEKQAKAFNEIAKVGSIIVTKLDGAARGGGALAAVVKTGAKISFIGVGEKIEELEIFDPPTFVNRLLGFGDVKAIVDRFRAYEELDKKRLRAMGKGDFTLLDLLDQLMALRKMGPLRKLVELLPGGYNLPADFERVGEENIKKWIAIMQSMTKKELLHPEIINRERMMRIAKGSGTSIHDVKALLKSYRMTKSYIKKLSKQRFKKMPYFSK
ncbi:MAG: signal recognition particle protein [Thermoprotei archaeon]|nr:MAG: signal recognition particle protein [Thermoprotei archaeon]